MRLILIFSLLLTTVGCASISKEESWSESVDTPSELLVFRVSGSHSKAMAAYFGSDKNYVVALKEETYSILEVPLTVSNFRVMGQGSTSSSIRLDLEPEKRTCLKLESNPAQWAAIAIPILLAAIPAFKSEEVECPNEEFFAKYTLVQPKL